MVGGIFDGLIDAKTDAQIRRKVDECCTVERNTEVVGLWLDELDQSGNPIFSKLDDLFRGDERHIAEAITRLERLKILGEKPKVMGQQERQCDRVRNKFCRSLRHNKPHLTAQERRAKADELTDEQIIESIQKVHHQVTGKMLAGPVGDVGEWLSSIWNFLCDHWLQILSLLLMFVL